MLPSSESKRTMSHIPSLQDYVAKILSVSGSSSPSLLLRKLCIQAIADYWYPAMSCIDGRQLKKNSRIFLSRRDSWECGTSGDFGGGTQSDFGNMVPHASILLSSEPTKTQ